MRLYLTYLFWPGLLTICVLFTQLGIAVGHGIIGFNLIYIALAATLWKLEQWFPHERAWLVHDNQTLPDLFHTLFNKGMVQVIVVVTTVIGVAGQVGSAGLQLWPTQWPMVAQVVLGLVVMEFGLYWKHRIAHEWLPLWPYHAVHHSSRRLWFFNTGRFHFVDTISGLLFGLPLLFVLGAPEIVFSWVAAITAYIGMLTHCNVEMRFGFLSLCFNTPELHRWHHSRRLRESNTNYGENITLWDHVFGSYFREHRRPPANIGISHVIPDHFLGQLKVPFTLRSHHFHVARRGTGFISRHLADARKQSLSKAPSSAHLVPEDIRLYEKNRLKRVPLFIIGTIGMMRRKIG